MKQTNFWWHSLLIACAASAAFPAVARTQPMTLADLERQALVSRQSLSAQQARIRQAAAEIERRRSANSAVVLLDSDAGFSPGGSLEYVAAADLNPDDRVLVQGSHPIGDRRAFAAQARYGATIDVAKTLYDFGRSASSLEAARAEQAAANADDRALRRQLLDDVRAAYLAWLQASEIAAISKDALADAQARRQRVGELVGEGAKPAADISPVASDEALARIELSRAQAEVENARLLLDAVVGGGVPATATPDRAALQISAPAPTVAPAAPATSTDASVEALESRRDAARATANMYDRMHSPVIAAETQLGVRAQNPITGIGVSGLFPTYRFGVTMKMTLWDGGTANANAGVARAQAEEFAARSREALAARQNARTQAEADAAAAQERLGIARELLTLSERRVRDAEARYEEARGTVEAIAEANAMRRRANTEIVLAEIATARARYTMQEE